MDRQKGAFGTDGDTVGESATREVFGGPEVAPGSQTINDSSSASGDMPDAPIAMTSHKRIEPLGSSDAEAAPVASKLTQESASSPLDTTPAPAVTADPLGAVPFADPVVPSVTVSSDVEPSPFATASGVDQQEAILARQVRQSALISMPKPASIRPWIIGGSLAAFLAIGGTATYVFAFYLPNLPENVWSTGLNRTGAVLASTVETMSSDDTVKKFERSQMTGSVTVTSSDDTSFKGSYDVKYDSKRFNASGQATLSTPEMSAKTLKANLIGEIAAGNQLPDMYMKISGLREVLSTLDPSTGILKYDDAWISIDDQYAFEQGARAEDTQDQQVTASDIADLSKDLVKVTSDYVFTADPAKAVVEKQAYVGKESVDDTDTYHYTAMLNRQHAYDYCTALSKKIEGSSAFAKLEQDAAARSESANEFANECKSSVDEEVTKANTLDVWVDLRYKMVYKIRNTDKQTGSYVEFGQKYDGGDDFDIMTKVHSVSKEADECINCGASAAGSVNDLSATFTINPKTATTSLKATYESVVGDDDKTNGVMTLSAKPYESEIDVAPPTTSTPIQTVLKDLGFDSGSTLQTRVQGAQAQWPSGAAGLRWQPNVVSGSASGSSR